MLPASENLLVSDELPFTMNFIFSTSECSVVIWKRKLDVQADTIMRKNKPFAAQNTGDTNHCKTSFSGLTTEGF